MTVKERAIEALCALPDDARLEDVMDVLQLMLKVERGLQDLDAGRTITLEQIRERVVRWLE